ncbi:caspase family protein [Planomonospora sp. ID67723]|uniref:caspase, EACC1-associated type n=1 Tax=Planomonospora sp. ID67723 TaxID=2738134 RepID=UPI0018C412C0|nr:YDG/SRA domain-containing protein [Planomonospora sp. ID67723]MBG0826390.1 caspase family protein [Planomonospora sp. ID67723]
MSLPDPLTSRAVLIGTSEYTHLDSLPAVANNLQALSNLLQQSDLWGLPAEHCTVVHNPTSVNAMMDPLWQAREEAKDTLIVYFAGHGLMHSMESDLYLALVDSHKDRIYRAVAYDTVRNELRESLAQRKIVILDCCYSGLALGLLGTDDPTERVANSARVTGTYLMTATAENRPALGGLDTYTAFTGELIHLIREGIPDQPELLELDTIFKHARESLRDKGLPTPQKRESNLAAHIPLVRNRAHKSQKRFEVKEFYGPIEGIRTGTIFDNRRALHDAGVHRPLQAGICGTADRGGAESIVVSGGYKDDEDYGDVIIYTGHGGRDPNTGEQTKDQSADDPGNAALIKSIMTGLPVRVIRGSGGNNRFSPPAGYSYDGLFRVADYWTKPGTDGPTVLQFRLEQLDDGSPKKTAELHLSRKLPPGRREEVAPGVYADRLLALELKQLYNHACQVCDTVLEVPGGLRFAATVHIRGIEQPHLGPDDKSNMLCLCPNHRDLFKYGAITIEDDFSVIDQTDGEPVSKLTLKHNIDRNHIQYHRQHHTLGHRKLRDELN